jgi:hypothetical protein
MKLKNTCTQSQYEHPTSICCGPFSHLCRGLWWPFGKGDAAAVFFGTTIAVGANIIVISDIMIFVADFGTNFADNGCLLSILLVQLAGVAEVNVLMVRFTIRPMISETNIL